MGYHHATELNGSGLSAVHRYADGSRLLIVQSGAPASWASPKINQRSGESAPLRSHQNSLLERGAPPP